MTAVALAVALIAAPASLLWALMATWRRELAADIAAIVPVLRRPPIRPVNPRLSLHYQGVVGRAYRDWSQWHDVAPVVAIGRPSKPLVKVAA